MAKILVTGSAGFIGAALITKLLEDEHEVVGIDNINDYYDVKLKYARLRHNGICSSEIVYNKEIIAGKYRFIKLDISDKKKLFTYLEGKEFTYICHLAAQAGVRYSIEKPDAYVESNIVGFLNILEYCRHNKIRHLVYASSSSVYGMNEKQPFSVEDNVDYPISLYAATKKSNELMAHCYSYLYGFKTTGLRFFSVYGPWGRPDMVPMLFATAICQNKPIKVFNHGALERDFTYIDDIINGLITVMGDVRQDILYKIYNIGNNHPLKLMDFIHILEKYLGKIAQKKFLPMQMGDVANTHADITTLYQDFMYKPITDIETGLGKFVQWYLKYYNIGDELL